MLDIRKFAPRELCGTVLAITTGFSIDSTSSKTLAVAFGHILAGVSSKTLEHFGQLILSKRFQRYDEGRIGNMQRYGTEKPPTYEVSNIVSPVLLICGQNDWVSSLRDVKELSRRLRSLVETYVIPEAYWSHNDHVWGREAPKLVYKKILDNFNLYGTDKGV
ncbi:lipase 3-like [Battus philenor]|uniref:lipase 3-like n=1 Tax=Battus philenor TaxID=42288 RepID=UPI0035CF49A3